MTRLGIVFAFTVLALLWAPVSAELLALDVRYSAETVLTLQDATTNRAIAASCGFNTAANNSQPPQRITFDVAAGEIRFRENTTETACGQAEVPLPSMPGVVTARLKFVADRAVGDTNPSPAMSPIRTNMRQELLFLDRNNTLALLALFSPSAGSVDARQFDVAIPPGTSHVAWYFEDRGYTPDPTLPGPGTGQAFSGTARLIDYVVMDAIAPAAFVEIPAQSENGTRVETTRVELEIPATWSNATVDLVIDMLPETTPVALEGALAGVDLQRLSLVGGLQRPRLVIPADVLANRTPGPSAIVLQRTTVLPIAPPTPPHQEPAIFWTAAMLPVAAAIFAAQGAYRYGREAEERFVRTARRLGFAVAAVLVIHLASTLMAASVVGAGEASQIPLPTEAIFVYTLMLVLLVLLLGLGWLIRQTLMRQMRTDLAERAAKQRELERSNRELEQFAYVASHDLQEPLRKVASFTQLLQKRYRGKLDPEADEYIGHAVDGARRMQTLVQDLLAYSRLGKQGQLRETVDLAQILESVQEDLLTRIRESRAQITAGRMGTVEGDPVMIRQLLLNLLGNALKYQPKGQRAVIRVWQDVEAAGSTLRVRDNGIGIAPEHRDRIFKLFTRLHGRGEYEGTGLGLAICQKVAELHGGTITVEPTRGPGTTFAVTFPKNPPGAS